jgi:serine/threonine protein phosphatase PrpC
VSPQQLRVLTGARTHEGRVRSNNEDSFIAAEQRGLWAVADGMGGHENGEWASACVVRELEEGPLPDDFDEACREIGERIHRANAIIFQNGVERGTQMGTTVVVLYVQGQQFAVLWVGDSRAYLLREGRLYQLSRDHTQVQEMVERGLLSPEEAEEHPMSHVLNRAVGVAEAVEVDVIQDEVEVGDTFLLCSDGLHGPVAEARISEILAGRDPEQAADSLLEAAFENGAPDNVTIVAARFIEPTFLILPQAAETA